MNAEVWLNGQSVGRRPYGYSTFEFDITPHLASGRHSQRARRPRARAAALVALVLGRRHLPARLADARPRPCTSRNGA